MSSFRDLKNASGRDSKIVRDFASLDICVSLGLSQTSYYTLISFGKGISLTFHLLARPLTVETTVIGRPPSQAAFRRARVNALRQRMAEEESGAWGSVDTRDVIVRLTGQQTNHATSK